MVIVYVALATLAIAVTLLVVTIVRLNRWVSAIQTSVSKTEKTVGAQESRIGSLSALVVGQSGVADAAGPLVSRLNDKDHDIRRAAAETLVRLGPKAIEPLIATVTKQTVPLSAIVDVLKRIDIDIAVPRFVSLPNELQGQLISILEKKELNNDDLLHLCQSDSPEVLTFVLCHERVYEALLQAIAQKGRLPLVLQEKIAYHHLADESTLRQLVPHADDKVLEKLRKDPNLSLGIQEVANVEIGARERKRSEEARIAAAARENDSYDRDSDVYYECWGIR